MNLGRLLCDGHGDVLNAAFPVENNAEGVAHLIKEITATARHRLRLVSTLVKNEIPYLAPEGCTRQATPGQIAAAAHAAWAIFQRKWRTVSGGLEFKGWARRRRE
jgi:hypothetical protein